MAIKIRPIGNKATRKRNKNRLLHRPSGNRGGRWHSRAVLWRARAKAKRKRQIAAESRRRNRGQ